MATTLSEPSGAIRNLMDLSAKEPKFKEYCVKLTDISMQLFNTFNEIGDQNEASEYAKTPSVDSSLDQSVNFIAIAIENIKKASQNLDEISKSRSNLKQYCKKVDDVSTKLAKFHQNLRNLQA